MLKPAVENLINHTGVISTVRRNRAPVSRFVSSQHLNPPILSRTVNSHQTSDARKQHNYKDIKIMFDTINKRLNEILCLADRAS
jgi:hypothetical protein